MSDIIEVIKDVTTVTIASDGPQGPAGPTGPTGPEGAAGPTGSSGVISVVAPITNTGTSTSAIIGINSGVANGVATLDSNGKVPQSQIPAVAITNTFVVASQAAMLALTAEEGDVAVRTDQNKTYILTATPSSTLANWQELLTPTDTVTSVDGRIGTVTLTDKYAQLATANTFTGGVQQITTASAATKGLIVKATASQTANLQEWQDSASTVLTRITSAGVIRQDMATAANDARFVAFTQFIGADATLGAVIVEMGANPSATGASRYGFLSVGDGSAFRNFVFFPAATANTNGRVGISNTAPAAKLHIGTGTAATVGTIIQGVASQTGNLQEWQDSAGTVLTYINSSGTFVGAGITILGSTFASGSVRSLFTTSTAAGVPVAVRGAASQTADLQQWQNSAGTVLSRVDSAGSFNIGSSTAPKAVLQVTQTASAPGAPTLGTASGGFYVSNFGGSYGFLFGLSGTGVGWIQNQRTDATATSYAIILQPSGGNIGIGSVTGSPIAKLQIQNDVAATVPFLVRGATSQSADATQWQTVGGALLTAITAAGTINFQTGNTSATANTGAVALPALAVGFITMQVAGTTVKVPYYAN